MSRLASEKPKNGASDSLEPSGSRTITDNGTSGLFMTDCLLTRAQIRTQMKAKRLSLSPEARQQASQVLCHSSLSLLQQYPAKSIAFYLPFQGEISPIPLMNKLALQGVQCALPVLHPFSAGYLQFARYTGEQDLCMNRFGILEPRLTVQNIVCLEEIELIFVPLVACDKQHNRLGMGGGFYDRTLALMPNAITVGLAHRCQQVEQLPVESWDIPLDHILLG